MDKENFSRLPFSWLSRNSLCWLEKKCACYTWKHFPPDHDDHMKQNIALYIHVSKPCITLNYPTMQAFKKKEIWPIWWWAECAPIMTIFQLCERMQASKLYQCFLFFMITMQLSSCRYASYISPRSFLRVWHLQVMRRLVFDNTRTLLEQNFCGWDSWSLYLYNDTRNLLIDNINTQTMRTTKKKSWNMHACTTSDDRYKMKFNYTQI